jgi:hypothetical protein
VDYAAIEREYEAELRAIENASHRCTLAALEIDAKRIEIRGEQYARVRLRQRDVLLDDRAGPAQRSVPPRSCAV